MVEAINKLKGTAGLARVEVLPNHVNVTLDNGDLRVYLLTVVQVKEYPQYDDGAEEDVEEGNGVAVSRVS